MPAKKSTLKFNGVLFRPQTEPTAYNRIIQFLSNNPDEVFTGRSLTTKAHVGNVAIRNFREDKRYKDYIYFDSIYRRNIFGLPKAIKEYLRIVAEVQNESL